MEKVYLVACEAYDAQAIASGLRAAAEALGVALPGQGEALLHVACPWAHPRFAPVSHTHPAVIEGLARALAGTRFTLGGNSLPGFPTRYAFRKAGYAELARRLGARLMPFDEAATRPVATGPKAAVRRRVSVPNSDAQFTVAIPKLTGSTFLPFAGALRHHYSLLPQAEQLEDHHRLPEKMADLLPVAPPDLIVVDAIEATHRGGELSGEPVRLGVLIVGTNLVAVDLAGAAAFGLQPAQVDFLQAAVERGFGPTSLNEVELLGNLGLNELRARGQRVERVDPYPEHFPLPDQIRVLRSPRARLAGVAGALAESFLILKRAGIRLERARETALVIGEVPEIPRGKSDYATIVFLDDTSRGEYAGYSRVIRLRGRNIPLLRLLQDVPFAMTVANLRAELGAEFLMSELSVRVSGLARGLRGRGDDRAPIAAAERR